MNIKRSLPILVVCLLFAAVLATRVSPTQQKPPIVHTNRTVGAQCIFVVIDSFCRVHSGVPAIAPDQFGFLAAADSPSCRPPRPF
jgi:hypothetical protein